MTEPIKAEVDAFSVPYPAKDCCCQPADKAEQDDADEVEKTLREAVREAWSIFDMLGAYRSDDEILAIIRSPGFSSAVFRVRSACIRIART